MKGSAWQIKWPHSGEQCGESTCGKGGSSGDGGDDFAGNKLGLELVDLGDGVVARAHVGQARDQVHVEVRVVVLFKRDWVQPEVGRQPL